MNTIRGSHYPHHPYFAQVCDEKGILFWSEMCFWGTGGDKQEGYWTASAYPPNESDQTAFEKSCLDQLEEMICTQRNHPIDHLLEHVQRSFLYRCTGKG